VAATRVLLARLSDASPSAREPVARRLAQLQTATTQHRQEAKAAQSKDRRLYREFFKYLGDAGVEV
jgi:hypothetical protein